MKTISRRHFLKFSSVALAGTALAACATPSTPQGGNASSDGSAPAAEQVTITYLIRNDIGANIQTWGEQAIADFEETYPNIRVETIGVPWGDYNAKLLALFAAGTPPEVSANYAAGFPTFYSNNAIIALDEFVAADGTDLSPIEEAALKSVTRQGQLWALPLAHMPVVVFYNKTLLDEAGVDAPPSDVGDTSWTTDQLLELATAVASNVDDPTAATWGLVFPPGQLGTYSWLWGVDPFNAEGGPEHTEAYQTGKLTEIHYTSPKIESYFQWLVDLTYDRQIAPRPTDVDAITQTVGWPFLSGRIGFYVQLVNSLGEFLNVQPEWEVGIAPLPYGPSGSNTTPLYNDSWMLSAGSAHPEEGYTFLKYLGLENGAKLYAEIAGFFPANKENYDIYFDSALNIPNLAVDRAGLEQAILGPFDTGFPSPGKTLESFPEWNTVFNQTTAPIFNNETSVADGLSALQANFEATIASKA